MAKKKQMLLIINPRSGREKIRLKLLDILDAYTGAGYQIQVHVTQRCCLKIWQKERSDRVQRRRRNPE